MLVSDPLAIQDTYRKACERVYRPTKPRGRRTASRKWRTGYSNRLHELLPILKEPGACPRSIADCYARKKPKEESQRDKLSERGKIRVQSRPRRRQQS